MNTLIDLKNMTLEELAAYVTRYGAKSFRAKQLFGWMYRQRVTTFEEMTDLSQKFREQLSQDARVSSLKLTKRLVSTDGTRKYLFTLPDGTAIESVMIPDEDRVTVCISTQVGCAMGCVFCLTGKMGFKRNLEVSEIVNQIMAVEEDLWKDPLLNPDGTPQTPKENGPVVRYVTNIVMMGMGEPLLNYDNVMSAIDILTSQWGYNFTPRRLTLSTVGITPQIKKFIESGVQVKLAISLTSADDEKRNQLLPINKKYSLRDLMEVIKTYPTHPRRILTFEYVMLQGINDLEEDAYNLVRLLSGITCKINLIPLNESAGTAQHRPNTERVLEFQKILKNSGMTVTIRESRGQDILAACGQLVGTENERIENPA